MDICDSRAIELRALTQPDGTAVIYPLEVLQANKALVAVLKDLLRCLAHISSPACSIARMHGVPMVNPKDRYETAVGKVAGQTLSGASHTGSGASRELTVARGLAAVRRCCTRIAAGRDLCALPYCGDSMIAMVNQFL